MVRKSAKTWKTRLTNYSKVWLVTTDKFFYLFFMSLVAT